jgi:hypothetical protein
MTRRISPRITSLKRRACLALVAGGWLLAVPETAVPQSRRAAPDTVRLRFNWPVGKVATVETTRFRERVTDRTDTFQGGGRYRMQVQQHPEGLLIAHDSFDIVSAAATPGLAASPTLQERVADLFPSYVVSRDGEFQRIDNVAGMRTRMSSLLQAGDTTGKMRDALESFVSEEVLNAIAAQDWNALVGKWVDADLELGETYELEEEAPIPLIPGTIVAMLSEFAIERRVPCSESGTTADCVQIHVRSHPDPEEVKMLIRRFVDRIASAPEQASFGFDRLELENELVLITEPATLLPHRARLTKSLKGVVVADGKKSNVSQLDVRTFRFTYR